MIYYELCEKIWGCSPATEQIDGGIETVELIPEDDSGRRDRSMIVDLNDDESTSHTATSGNTQPSDKADEDDDNLNEEETDHDTVQTIDAGQQGTIGKRRELLDEKLKTNRHDKMKRKLPVDSQMLGCAQEELAIKRQLVEQVDKMDQRYAETMDKMSQNIEKLTSSITDGFLLLKQMMGYQQPPTMYWQIILMDLLTRLFPECHLVILHLAIVIASIPVNLTTYFLMESTNNRPVSEQINCTLHYN